MSAANPYSPSTMDNKPSEPSMEEILASIRRIIADDQSIPTYGAPRAPVAERASEPAPAHEPIPVNDEATVRNSFIGEPPADVEPDSSERLDADDRIPSQHGAIAAPQYPMPDGPVDEPRASESEGSRDRPEAQFIPRMPPIEAQAEPCVAANRFAEMPRTAPETITALSSTVADPEPEEEYYVDEETAVDEHPYDQPLATAEQGQPQDASGLFSAETDSSIASAFNMLAASRLADNSDELMTLVRDMIRPLLRGWLDDNLPTMVERMVRAEIERVARGGR